MAVSFGMERLAAFEHAKSKTKISVTQPNGTIYTFGKDVNIIWRHGIPGRDYRHLNKYGLWSNEKLNFNCQSYIIIVFFLEISEFWKSSSVGNPHKAVHPSKYSDQGRISIIAWGWVDQMEEMPI